MAEPPSDAADAGPLDVDALRRWLTCVCVVHFDVDYGQVIEHQVPAGSLDSDEATALCYLSFPDSHATALGDTEFVFRMPRTRAPGSSPSSWRIPATDDDDGSGESAPFEDATHSPRALYGFALFRQERDPNLSRGTFQKSIVVVSSLPHVRLYRAMARLLAPLYFTSGPPAVERALRDVCAWPAPVGGQVLELRLLSARIRARLCVPSMGLRALQASALEEASAPRGAAAKPHAPGRPSPLCGPPACMRVTSELAVGAHGAAAPSHGQSRRGGGSPLGPSGGFFDVQPPRADSTGPISPRRTNSAAGDSLLAGAGRRTQTPPPLRTHSASMLAMSQHPSLSDVLQSATDSFAPLQDVSLLRAFAPSTQGGRQRRFSTGSVAVSTPAAPGGGGAAGGAGDGAPAAAGGGAGSGAGASGGSTPAGPLTPPGGLGVDVGDGGLSADDARLASPAGGGELPLSGAAAAAAYECLWTHWELVITGTTLLVHSASPTRCSDAVLALVSLIAPVPFCGDFRPYFTIHDADFERYAASAREPPPAADGSGRGAILGVTNPYFLKMRQPWHTVIALDQPGAAAGADAAASNLAGALALGLGGGTGSSSELLVRTSSALGGGGGGGGGIRTRRAPVVTPDQIVLKQLADLFDADSASRRALAASAGGGAAPLLRSCAAAASAASDASGGGGGGGGGPGGAGARRDGSATAQRGAPTAAGALKIANELLRQHFRETTMRFLMPLEMYGARGFIPAAVDWGHALSARPAQAPAAWMQTFDRDRFLRELSAVEPPPLPRSLVSRRSDLVKLYECFTDTPHFRLWWHDRRSETLRQINASYELMLASQRMLKLVAAPAAAAGSEGAGGVGAAAPAACGAGAAAGSGAAATPAAAGGPTDATAAVRTTVGRTQQQSRSAPLP